MSGRRLDNDNFYYLQILSNTNPADSVKLLKYVGGVATELGTIDVTIAAGDTFKLEITDGTKKVYHNGSEVLSSTDNALTAAGTWGVYFGNYNGAVVAASVSGHLRDTWAIDDFLAEEPASTVVANITDNDSANAVLSVTTQGDETGPQSIVYTVTLDNPNDTGAAITFDLAFTGGNAVAGSDYTDTSGAGVISVAAGATTGTLVVPVLDDPDLEALETLEATLSNPSNGAVTVTGPTATASITDNDSANAVLSVTTQGDENGLVNIVYTVTLSQQNDTGAAITFDIDDTFAGTATSGSDYVAIPGAAQISVADGATIGTYTVTVSQDVLLEATETLEAQISNPSNAAVTVTGATATANIADDETANAVLSVTTQGDETGPQNIVYTVTLSRQNDTGAAITFDLAFTGGNAVAGSDYTDTSGVGVISVAAGATTGTLVVPVLDDPDLEALETLEATLSNPSNGAVSVTGPTATANIIDNDSANAVLSVTTQGDENGLVDIVYTVTLSRQNDTGAAQISVADGATTGTFTVTVSQDLLLEATETVQAQISNSSNAAVTITGSTATANIVDDETANAVLSVTTQGDETGPQNIVYTVTLSRQNDTGVAITFDVAFTGGNAVAGSDFTDTSGVGVISVAAGATTGTLVVPVLDDADLEALETLEATLSNPSNGAVTVTGPTATANIVDDETANAVLSVTTQGDENGLVDIVYTVTLDKTNNTGAAITFDIDDTFAGTATSGSDYVAIPGAAQISVADGATTGTFTVTVSQDLLLEGTETVQAQISNSSNAAVTVTGSTATANIVDDETANTVLSVTTQGDETGPQNIVYTVTLSRQNDTGAAITFDVAFTGGNAVAGSDYTDTSGVGVISVAAGATTGTLVVPVLDDADLEALETLEATLSNPSIAAVTVTGPTATANISDNDSANAVLSVTTQGDENGLVDIVYTVTLSQQNNTGAAITFDIDDTFAGTATSGVDYGAIPGAAQISVADSATTGTYTVTVNQDLLLEGTETVQAQISNSSNAAVTITGSTATANIVDDETANAVLSVTTQGDETGPQSIVYTVTLDKQNDTGAAITFDVTFTGGNAVAGSDYTDTSGVGVISVAAGATTGTLVVPVLDDADLEALETLEATLSNPSNGAVSVTGPTATANISDNDSANAVLSVTTQGDENGLVDIVYTVTLDKTNNTGAAITFDIDDTFAGTATSGSDYVAIPGAAQISVADGATTGTFTVTVSQDLLLEATETVQAQISNSSNAAVTITGSTATANIVDDETANAVLSVTTQGDETGPQNIVYTVTLSRQNDTGAAITFDVAFTGGNAVAGSDYTDTSGVGVISVAAGASTGTLVVPVLDDADLEALETLEATLSNPSNGAVTVTGPTATANITDNDSANAVLSVTTQGDENGLVDIVYMVSLSQQNNTGAAITFDIDDTFAGTATSGSDYVAIPGAAQISVADGATTGTFTVTVSQDALLEATETVQAQISNSSNAAVTITGPTATANIVDDETANAVLSVTTQGDETGPQNIVYTVTLSRQNDTGAAITFDVAFTGGNAVAGSDFTDTSGVGVISVAAGASTGTLVVPVLDDADLEALETLEATLSNPSNGAVSVTGPTATANITDNDSANAVLSVTTQGDETGPQNIVYTVTLSRQNDTGAAITFDVGFTGGNAVAGSDYTDTSGVGVISVAAGATTGTLVVPVLDDADLEALETLEATLSNPSNGAVSVTGPTATANITDNDSANAVLSVTTQGDENGLVNIVYTVTLESRQNNTGAAITFDIDDTFAGTATSGSDYVAIPGAAQISCSRWGDHRHVHGDSEPGRCSWKPPRRCRPRSATPSNAAVTITGSTATANIVDDETANAVLSVTTQGDETGPQNIVYTVTLESAERHGCRHYLRCGLHRRQRRGRQRLHGHQRRGRHQRGGGRDHRDTRGAGARRCRPGSAGDPRSDAVQSVQRRSLGHRPDGDGKHHRQRQRERGVVGDDARRRDRSPEHRLHGDLESAERYRCRHYLRCGVHGR